MVCTPGPTPPRAQLDADEEEEEELVEEEEEEEEEEVEDDDFSLRLFTWLAPRKGLSTCCDAKTFPWRALNLVWQSARILSGKTGMVALLIHRSKAFSAIREAAYAGSFAVIWPTRGIPEIEGLTSGHFPYMYGRPSPGLKITIILLFFFFDISA